MGDSTDRGPNLDQPLVTACRPKPDGSLKMTVGRRVNIFSRPICIIYEWPTVQTVVFASSQTKGLF